jgi:hypothetical protein
MTRRAAILALGAALGGGRPQNTAVMLGTVRVNLARKMSARALICEIDRSYGSHKDLDETPGKLGHRLATTRRPHDVEKSRFRPTAKTVAMAQRNVATIGAMMGHFD